VVLPRGYDDSGTRRYPAAYVIPGFGGDHHSSWETEQTELVWVFLEASFPTGHHEFADSVNNGPWGEALVTELIPYLEKRFRLRPSARFLTGHSSGGWSSLWLQVTYPDFFHGTWSTAPDPVDFRSFSGINVTPGSTDNVYRASDGSPRNLIRGSEVTFEEFARAEQVLGEYGGQLASFEAVFSPRGEDGRPMRMFNRSTGELNPNTIAAWQKYNIRRKLAENWKALEPRLRGKIHVFCGDQDTFHLEEAASLLCDFLAGVRAGATCEIIPERDHMDLYRRHEKHYPEGLHRRIAAEMEARYRALRPRPKKKTAGSGLQ
jgi:S-formylglutathione hydrolase FrmB